MPKPTSGGGIGIVELITEDRHKTREINIGIRSVAGKDQVCEDLRERLIGTGRIAGQERIREIGEWILVRKRRAEGWRIFGGREANHAQEQVDLLRIGANRRRAGALRFAEGIWVAQVEIRRASGRQYVGKGTGEGKIEGFEEPALIGVRALKHGDANELAGRKGWLQAARQDLRAEIGRDPVGSEHFALSGEDACDRRRAQTGRVVRLRAAQDRIEAGTEDRSIHCSDGTSCSIYAPLSMIALRNRPVAVVVEARLLETLRPPADSPPTVTFLASPPKPAMLRCTHCRANC